MMETQTPSSVLPSRGGTGYDRHTTSRPAFGNLSSGRNPYQVKLVSCQTGAYVGLDGAKTHT
jgi:hypothetical protein